MCLAVPGKVLEIDGTTARVDFGHGAVREVDISLVEVTVGKYVLVHTGYAIQIMEEDEAKASLNLWDEIMKSLEGK